MPPKTATTNGNISKKRLRSHTKSRTGCRNCKIRKVKCDETKPSCVKCESYGVSCSFGGTDLLELNIQNSIRTGKTTSLLELSRCSPVTTMLGMVNKTLENCNMSIADSPSTIKMELDDLACVERFQSRTVLSLGTSITGQVYQQQIIKLVCQHPYLIHAVMTITYMHDRYLKEGIRSKRSLAESYHYAQAASLFRQKLSTNVPACDHDGLWATCALLGSISFFAMDSNTPYESWPLENSPSDLEWLEVLEGIHVVWAIIQPTRPGSAFEGLSRDRSKEYLLTGRSSYVPSGVSDLPQAFVALCGVDDSSTATNNPYLVTLHNLAPLLDMTCDQNTFLCFLTFTGHMDSAFKQLLRMKDARSLLILAYWYAKLCYVAPWFMATRALIECQAICIYLERYHAHRKDIQDLLVFPKAQCGLFMDQQSLTSFSIDQKEVPVYTSICV